MMLRNLMPILLIVLLCFILILAVTITAFTMLSHAASKTGVLAKTASQTSPVYYGVHVPGQLNDLSALTTFENDAQKKVAIAMFYQGWGVTDGTQYFEASWMNNVHNDGAIPMVTWEPWLYTAGVNQPTFALHAIISGSFDPYIREWAKAS